SPRVCRTISIVSRARVSGLATWSAGASRSRAKSSRRISPQRAAWARPVSLSGTSCWPCRRRTAFQSVSPWRMEYRNGSGMNERVLILGNTHVGRLGMLHPDDVIAGIDVMDLAGHAARHVGEQIDRGGADLLDRHGTAQRRVELVPFENIAEVPDARG